MVQRRRRVNVEKKMKVETATSRLNEIAERNAEITAQMEKLQAEMTELGTEAAGLMNFLKVDELHCPGLGTHTYKPPVTRGTNVVDPKGFMELAGENAFWAVAQVGITKAKEHLGEKELATITTQTPGAKKPAVYGWKK